MVQQWMIYGTYGYTGELIAREAVHRGLKPTPAVRSASKLTPFAQELGLATRALDVAKASSQLNGINIALNCAAPLAKQIARIRQSESASR